MKKTKVMIDDHFECEVIRREELQKIIFNVTVEEVASQLLQLADSYDFQGTAFMYIDAETGKLREGWVEDGQSLYPEDRTKIILMSEPTPFRWENVFDEHIIDPMSDEWEKFQEWKDEQGWDTDVFTFLEQKYGKGEIERRKSLVYEGFIENMEFADNIGEQIDLLYGDQTPHDEIINNIENIVVELNKGNDVTIKKGREGIRILSYKPKKINK